MPRAPLFLKHFLITVALVFAAASPGVAHDLPTSAPGVAAPGSGNGVTRAGTIDELVVEDRLTSTTTRYPLLRANDGATLLIRGEKAEALPTGASVEVTGALGGTTLEVTQVQIRAPAAQDKGTSTSDLGLIEARGQFAIAHYDDFANGTGGYIYEALDPSGKSTRLALGFLPAGLRAGMQIVVSGRLAADGTTLVPVRITIIGAAPSTMNGGAMVEKSTQHKILVVLAYFTGQAAPAAFNATPVMVTNTASVAAYYNEVSYGQHTLSVTVMPNWAQMSGFPLACPDTNLSGFTTAANNAALGAGFNPANYDDVVYLFPSAGCGWSGLAWVGAPGAFINGTGSFVNNVVAHEMGHNFGLLHAGSLRCTGQPIGCGASGSVAEYGDPFSTMGNQHAGHFNSAQKSILGWFTGSQVVTHNSGTQTYTLYPIETAGQTLYAVKIPTSNANRTYWVEFRQPVGNFDTFAYTSNGAQIRIAYPFEASSGADDTELLDMTPGTGSYTDATLTQALSPFTDASTGVNISVLSVSAASVTIQVSKGGGSATTTTLSSSLNPSTSGQSVTFTATVTGTNPTGTVNFTDGGTTIGGCGSAALSGGGNSPTATCTTSTLSVGTHSIVANYSGDASNATSASSTLSQVVNSSGGTTTTLTSSLNPSTFGASVTLTATVTGNAPTGSVNFKDAGTSIAGCSAAVLSGAGNSRTATCTTTTLAVGTHSIVATYSGDANNTTSSSTALSQVVNGAATTTTLTSSLNPSTFGASVTLTATVTGNAPTGSVNFKDAGTSITGCSAAAVSGAGNSRTATCTTTTLAVGTHSIVATYSGDANNATSSSTALSQVVNNAGSGTTLASSLNPSTVGASVTFTATVTGNAPTGTVNFMDGAASIANCSAVALAGSGNSRTAQCATSALSVGSHSITAAYSGDANNAASTSSALNQVVNNTSGSTTTLSSSVNPVTVGSPVTFSAIVSGNLPTGIVVFTDNGVSIGGCGAVALTGSGNAKSALCTTSSLALGSHSIVASYGGDAGNGASSSNVVTEVVNSGGGGPAPVNVALASSGGNALVTSTLNQAPYVFGAAALIDGDHKGTNWSKQVANGGWMDATYNAFPDAVQIDFNAVYTIDHVVLYTLQDNFSAPVEPSDTMTFSLYGVTDFYVQVWDGANWVTVGTVNGNNLVKRTVSFAPYATAHIRVVITGALAGFSRLTEIEAWTTSGGGGGATATTTGLATTANPINAGTAVTFTASVSGNAPTGVVAFTDGGVTLPGCAATALAGASNLRTAACTASSLATGNHSIVATYGGDALNLGSTSSTLTEIVNSGGPAGETNWALAANGGNVLVTSTLNQAPYVFGAAALNDGERAGIHWATQVAGGGWMDGTYNAFPDAIQIDLSGLHAIDRVTVYTLQDNFGAPVEPTDTMTFSLYGVTDFFVQGWNGSSWVTLATVNGNNLVKRTVTFAPFATANIRIFTTNALAGFSRLTEIEVWGP